MVHWGTIYVRRYKSPRFFFLYIFPMEPLSLSSDALFKYI